MRAPAAPAAPPTTPRVMSCPCSSPNFRPARMTDAAASVNPSANGPWSVDASYTPLANPAAMATGETATMLTSAQNSRLFSVFSEFSLLAVFPLFSALSTCYFLSHEWRVNIRHQLGWHGFPPRNPGRPGDGAPETGIHLEPP